uniref:Major intrinsic protein n=1 Tax=viral metagenome TaxID=1070528 RepID=A0A6C0I7N9_9ZZZZ
MNQTYILEFIGAMILAFLISLFGKGYAHLVLSIMLLLTGTLFTSNCFNPAIALCFFLTNKITLSMLWYYFALEISGALTGYYCGAYIKDFFIILL